MEIYPLPEGQFFAMANHTMVPVDEHPSGGIRVGICPFLLRLDNGQNVLLDCGLGHQRAGKLVSVHNLENLGLAPSDITWVLLSHLHYDHVQGAIDQKRHQLSLTFPRATHVISKPHFDYIVTDQSHMVAGLYEKLLFLQRQPNVWWVGDTLRGQLPPIDVHYMHTHGHCPYHLSFFFPRYKVFYGGDEMPQYCQMVTRMVTKYDYDSRESARLRAHWYEQGQKEKWTCLFFHDTSHNIHRF